MRSGRDAIRNVQENVAQRSETLHACIQEEPRAAFVLSPDRCDHHRRQHRDEYRHQHDQSTVRGHFAGLDLPINYVITPRGQDSD
jgi:hypothetical protein